MDLDRVKLAVAGIEQFDDDEREAYGELSDKLLEQFDKSFPAIAELDRAAFAWYIAELLATLREVPLKTASDCLADSSVGYSMATAKLLGWIS